MANFYKESNVKILFIKQKNIYGGMKNKRKWKINTIKVSTREKKEK